MLQAIGLTSHPRRDLPPAVDDLTFDAAPGQITALLGPPDAGKTTALRLMLELDQGRGITYFRGLPLHRIARPAAEVGTLLGDVPGNPARTVRGQLRMLCAATGVPASRADELLEAVDLVSLADERLGTLSRAMDRRLGLAVALLADPQTLVLDEPVEGLSARDSGWLFGLLRDHAAQGGTVLYTTSDPKSAARTADHVVTIEAGRLVADQEGAEFARTRLRPRVAVRTPHTARLAGLLGREAREGHRSVEVVTEGGSRLSVYGSSCAEIGEAAFRHGVLIHQLADETGDMGPGGETVAPASGVSGSEPVESEPAGRRPLHPEALGRDGSFGDALDLGPFDSAIPAADAPVLAARSVLPEIDSLIEARSELSEQQPVITPLALRGPVRPLRYELRRLFGVRTALLVVSVVLAVSVALSVLLARTGGTPLSHLLMAWPGPLPLPPAAFAAGLLGALAFGDEFRYPALAVGRGGVPRRFGLLVAKLAVSGGTAFLLALLTAAADAGTLRLVYGGDLAGIPPNWLSLAVGWVGLTVGCAWAGLLGAGVFKSTTAGLAAVLSVPVAVVPLMRAALAAPAARSVAGLPARLREVAGVWPGEADRWLVGVLRLLSQPVGAALVLSLAALLCAFLFTGLRGRARW
ncbi:ABC transporter ATP-binding protein [Streptomyces sp. SID10853]|uniref:ATP-binding cassette domain-containing protein n=1 Tax=Streptomyces sp. SID10853 TaxID=2706028 RepID=UPI0013C148B2|nr:ABC transporter ATP-binding protein [Streptomyces sp. SID10853]NDZ77472.1 ABC transporter ATP-binding protein [Streptomyces sp. SID10853]